MHLKGWWRFQSTDWGCSREWLQQNRLENISLIVNKWEGNNLIKKLTFVWPHKYTFQNRVLFSSASPDFGILTKLQTNQHNAKHKPPTLQRLPQNSKDWEVTNLRLLNWWYFPNLHTIPSGLSPSILLSPVLGGSLSSTLSTGRRLSQTPWIWLCGYTMVRSRMPWALQELGFNHWEVPSGPKICEFRNWPNSVHMAPHHWGGRGRHLAQRRK